MEHKTIVTILGVWVFGSLMIGVSAALPLASHNLGYEAIVVGLAWLITGLPFSVIVMSMGDQLQVSRSVEALLLIVPHVLNALIYLIVFRKYWYGK